MMHVTRIKSQSPSPVPVKIMNCVSGEIMNSTWTSLCWQVKYNYYFCKMIRFVFFFVCLFRYNLYSKTYQFCCGIALFPHDVHLFMCQSFILCVTVGTVGLFAWSQSKALIGAGLSWTYLSIMRRIQCISVFVVINVDHAFELYLCTLSSISFQKRFILRSGGITSIAGWDAFSIACLCERMQEILTYLSTLFKIIKLYVSGEYKLSGRFLFQHHVITLNDFAVFFCWTILK